jgi:hypothetical protein
MRRLLGIHNVLPLALGVIAVVIAAAGWANAAGTGGTITVCVHHKGGGLYEGKRCARHDMKLSWNTQGPAGAPGPRGSMGPAGTNGTNGTNGANGLTGTARAYGFVNGTTVTRSKNITGVTNPVTGVFCISLAAGIDASSTGAVVTPDIADDATDLQLGVGAGNTNAQAIVEWEPTANRCPAGALEVETAVREELAAADPQGGATFITGVANVQSNQPFFIVVP